MGVVSDSEMALSLDHTGNVCPEVWMFEGRLLWEVFKIGNIRTIFWENPKALVLKAGYFIGKVCP